MNSEEREALSELADKLPDCQRQFCELKAGESANGQPVGMIDRDQASWNLFASGGSDEESRKLYPDTLSTSQRAELTAVSVAIAWLIDPLVEKYNSLRG